MISALWLLVWVPVAIAIVCLPQLLWPPRL